MNNPEYSSHLVVTVVGGGTAGENAAGILDAVESGLVPGIESAEVSVIVGSQDNGSRTGDLRSDYRLHAPGDYRRTISALSSNTYAAPIFERRLCGDASTDTVQQYGDELLTALSYSDTIVDAERGQQIIDQSVTMAAEFKAKHNSLHGLTIGHLVIASLMKEHRSKGNGKNAQTAIDEAATFMATRGRVLVDSMVPHELGMRDGAKYLHGEEAIDNHTVTNPSDVEVWVSPSDDMSTITVPASPDALTAIREADVVVSAPGSQYTSRIAPFLNQGLAEAMAAGEAENQSFVFIANLDKEKPDDPTIEGPRALKELEKYAGRTCTRVVLNHNLSRLPEGLAISFTQDELAQAGSYNIVSADLVGETGVIQDPNNPIKTRSKVRTNMTAAAIAALSRNHQTAAMAAA